MQATVAAVGERGRWVPVAVAAAVFAGLSLAAAVTSAGFLEADACTHYLYARFAVAEPHYLVNVWGRPVCTGLYAIPALLGGRLGVRVCSLLVALAIATIAMLIARGQGYRRPALAFIFTLAEPLVFLHSFAELTELPFALLLGAAFLAYQRRVYWAMALLAGLLPLGRPEGFGFILLALAGLVAHRRFQWIPLLLAPLVLWDYAGWEMFGRPEGQPWWRWLIDNWPYEGRSQYQRGHLLHFVALLPVVTGPLVFPSLWVGWWREGSGVRGQGSDELPVAGCQLPVGLTGNWKLATGSFLIAAIPLIVLVVHSLLYWTGRMASNGEVRYMLVVAPFWGLLVARGWESIFDRFRWSNVYRWAGLAALLPALANLHYPVVPLELTGNDVSAREVANWYRASPLRKDYPYLLACNTSIFYFLDQSFTDTSRSRQWHQRTVAETPPGTLLIWDPVYGPLNSDAQRCVTVEQILKAGWLPLEAGDAPLVPGWQLFLSPAPQPRK